MRFVRTVALGESVSLACLGRTPSTLAGSSGRLASARQYCRLTPAPTGRQAGATRLLLSSSDAAYSDAAAALLLLLLLN